MQRKISFLAYLLAIVFLPFNLTAQEPDWTELGGDISDVGCLLIFADNPQDILAGNCGNIFRSQDGGKNWTRVLSLRGKNKKINQILSARVGRQIIYAATDNGLYASLDAGARWQRVFSGKNQAENTCTGLAVEGEMILLGTNNGLYTSKDNGRSWEKETGVLGHSRILNIEASFMNKVEHLYVTSINGVFRKQNGAAWEKIYGQSDKEDCPPEEDQAAVSDEQGRYFGIRYIKFDQAREGLLYLATTKGVYKSTDAGNSWSKLAEYGLLDRDVKYLCLSESSQLFAVTNSGVFVFHEDRWLEQTSALSSGVINTLAIAKPGILYLGAGKGIFRSGLSGQVVSYGVRTSDYSANEPKIVQVQQVAIAYAEVSPEKIKNWRRRAAKKAFLPEVSVGLDRNSTDLWHWETGSTAVGQGGDDLLRRGRDSIDWDVRLSWDLGKIIWNEDQTSIDGRSKLMVQYMNWNISTIVI